MSIGFFLSVFHHYLQTVLSISKIAALASDVPQDEKDERVEALNHQLQLIEYQENLPAEVLDVRFDRLCVCAPL